MTGGLGSSEDFWMTSSGSEKIQMAIYLFFILK